MKKIIGKLSQKLICKVSVATRARLAASAGMGVPFTDAARVHTINRFWQRQAIPHTFRNRMVPRPPPIAMQSVRLLAPGCAKSETTNQKTIISSSW